ncbi:uncharacterized protein G2W53_019571 [Senna tora]|uniref:Uncharacterized protein n=1 Tax=Senna tora TaxID=362788 RepID=A0A834TUA5_9FABA|nr:uncharacterized protein G2W53_019571 [Senna tora]
MGGIGCNADGILDDAKFSQPVPWVGIYIAAASLACLIGMAVDAILGISHRKLWFPCKYFSLNATSLTLIAVALKLSVDLNTSMPRHHEQLAKLSSSALICTIIVMISSALTVPTTKHLLEYKYRKKYEMAIKECSALTHGPITQRYKNKLMKYWMMAHTSSPQFVLGRSPTCTASGAFCLLSALLLAEAMLRSYFMPWSFRFCSGESDYKWSTILILVVQGAAVVVGTIAPAFRWFVAIKFRCPQTRNVSHHKKEFIVEQYWIESLLEMRDCPLNLRIRHRHCRKLAHDAKVFLLNLCIRMQMGIVLMSKLTRIISISLVSSILSCFYHCKKVKFSFNNTVSSVSSGSEGQGGSKPDLSRFVLHLEGEEALVGLMMRDNRDATNHWIQVGEKRQPKLLIQLLEKSSVLQGFKGVGEFDSDQVPSLHPVEPPYSWSLPLVTLTCVAMALPDISKSSVKNLIDAVNEGFPYVKAVENTLDKEGRLIRVMKAAAIVWHGADLYHKWFDLDLTKLSLQAESSKEALQKLADTAKTRYEKFKIKNINVCLRASPSEWPIKVLAANSMYRISKTILLNCGIRDDFRSETLLEELTLVIADILGSCFTNIPHVISAKCVKSAIEEREDSVRHASYIFGKTKKIIEMLEERAAIPNVDKRCMTKIDDWRSMHKQNSALSFSQSSPEGNSETTSKSSDLCLTVE